jgi:hypothetical protein
VLDGVRASVSQRDTLDDTISVLRGKARKKKEQRKHSFYTLKTQFEAADEFGHSSSTEDLEELPEDSAKSIQARR